MASEAKHPHSELGLLRLAMEWLPKERHWRDDPQCKTALPLLARRS
ncbi:MAG: hypothetical protein PHS96_08935 [Anaerolineales bacterium]|nr:hypothetical protein [Anaerolineales bacterium]